jgi:lysozyme
MTEEGKAALMVLENVSLTVYPDSAGLPTIGIGHRLTKDELTSGKIWIGRLCLDYRKGLTRAQTLVLMEADVATVAPAIRKVAVPLNPWQNDALAIFTFNIGSQAFRESTLLKKLNAGLYAEVPAQMRRWIYAGGRIISGLIRRREAEIRIWKTPIPAVSS